MPNRKEGNIAGHMDCHADFGGERRVDIEFGEQLLWISIGAAVNRSDVWIKSAVRDRSLRLKLDRLENGLQIAVDTGEQTEHWWPTQAAPRLLITMNPQTEIVSVRAAVGAGEHVREVLLDQTGLTNR